MSQVRTGIWPCLGLVDRERLDSRLPRKERPSLPGCFVASNFLTVVRFSTPDMASNVVHERTERCHEEQERSAFVNNLAASQNDTGSRGLAPAASRSFDTSLAKARVRPPVAAGASEPTSERTLPREGPCIRLRPSRKNGKASHPKPSPH